MCRFVAYLGQPILLNEVIAKPRGSLVRQSFNARESSVTLNGDGFGVGWYLPQISQKPGLFRSIYPAWSDLNLNSLIHHIASPCFLAHVRAASTGGLSQFNSHPFHCGRYLFMHNGGIGGFNKIKRDLINTLDEALYLNIQGQTDSEVFFHLILQAFFHEEKKDLPSAIKSAIKTIETLQKKYHIEESNTINIVLSDGETLTATRYVSNSTTEPALSLYYAAGSTFTYTGAGCHMLPAENGHNEAVIISSERLTDFSQEWVEIPVNQLIEVNAEKMIRIISL